MTGTSSTGSSSADATATTDVLVVGAGPTGLLLAGDLAVRGVSVTLVERRPRETGNTTRAFAVHARTLELLDARGLADALIAAGTTLTDMRLFGRLSLDLSRLRTRFPFLLITPQYEVEHLLRERALKAGVEFRYGTELLGLVRSTTGETVTADIRDPAGARSTVEARFLVGTDGVRSTVRRALGLPFPGESVIKSMVLADVRLTDTPPGLLTVNGVGEAFAFIAPFGDGWYRVMGWNRTRQAADSEPVELDELRGIARLALGTDYGMHDARWISRFHSDERQVPAYRVGRVFLAGDAAHVHSPAGGQGMNTGLQDAAKSLLEARGRPPRALRGPRGPSRQLPRRTASGRRRGPACQRCDRPPRHGQDAPAAGRAHSRHAAADRRATGLGPSHRQDLRHRHRLRRPARQPPPHRHPGP
ncbi:2-polyprenyl-6-methoxyphenol hydroxylase-like FAD-dependent oxidoreductase [Streptomyces sp. B1I3]|nr:2-polyprenyl-6-methoxyphenol hydroxylase-like FAD-dependent oxidoreductase [Streptomyces sp. B1I3]